MQERLPVLMVPHVVTFGVVIYTNGGFKGLENEVGLIQAIIEAYEQQKLIDLTDKLRTAGWRSDCDAQYSNLAKLAKEERWI